MPRAQPSLASLATSAASRMTLLDADPQDDDRHEQPPDRSPAALGGVARAPLARVEVDPHALLASRQALVAAARAEERALLRECLEAMIIPELEMLVDPTADPGQLRAMAAAQARRLRHALKDHGDADVGELDADVFLAREDERHWVRGHVHDTVLQILEFIAGDGFGTRLPAAKIAELARTAAVDLGCWLDDEPRVSGELMDELEHLLRENPWTSEPAVQLMPPETDVPLLGEQVSAIVGAVREAVTNARKHARASRVTIRVQAGADGGTVVTVIDDGIGIPLEWWRASGVGIRRSIVGRMRRAGGEASLGLAPGQGTCVTLFTSRRGTGR